MKNTDKRKLKRKILKEALGIPITSYQKFHQLVRLDKVVEKTDNISKPELKEYLRLEKIFLPDPDSSQMNWENYIAKEIEPPSIKTAVVTLEQLSNLLYFSRKFNPNWEIEMTKCEIYIISFQTELPDGLYHYNSRINAVEILPGSISVELKKALPKFRRPRMLVLISGKFFQLPEVNQEFRYIKLIKQSGYLAQNVLINCYALELQGTIIEGFVNDYFDELLNLESLRESVLEIISIN